MSKYRIIFLNLILSAIVIAVAYTAFIVDRFLPFLLPESLEIVAWPFLVFGILIITWSAILLARLSGASGAPGDPTKNLVIEGPYAWIRNPIYASDVIIIVGLAFFSRSPSMLVYALLFGIGMDAYVRKVEEPATERRLGKEYLKYKESVPRWFPKIKRENG